MANINKAGPIVCEGLTACWETCACLSSSGYGQIMVDRKQWNTHRFSWWLHNGCPDLSVFEKKHILHECDNKRCCNPAHLRLGTPTENALEAVQRIRKIKPPKVKRAGNYNVTAGSFKPGNQIGELNNRAKLTIDDVTAIRSRHAAGLKYGELKQMATEYGIAYNTIQKIVANKLWKE